MSAVSTAFQKAHEARKPRSTLQGILKQIDTVYRSMIPDPVLEMPMKAMYFVGICSYLTALILFCIIVARTYYTNITQVYLSPNNIESLCTPVLRTNTGDFLGDTNGYWDSSANFRPTQAVYAFSIRSMAINNSFWTNIMGQLNQSLVAMSYSMPNSTLTDNILVWTSYSASFLYEGTVQSFNLYGDASVIFNRQYILGTLSNVDADCNITAASSFNTANYRLSMVYDYSEFANSPVCRSVIEPNQVGYNGLYDGNTITIDMDMRSFVTAQAINMGVLLLPNLQMLDNSLMYYPYNGSMYTIANYYDPRYPGMDPIYCVVNEDTMWINDDNMLVGNTSCGIELQNSTYSIPVFNPFGYSSEFPSYCACDDGTGPGVFEDGCSEFNFLVGLLMYDNTGDSTFEKGNPFMDIQNKIPIRDMNKAAYNAMYAAAMSSMTDQYQNSSFRESAYEFCDVGYASCSIVTINLFDDVNRAVTGYYYQLLNGSCSNSITIAPASYNELSTTPPVPLEESYYNCKQSPSTVLSSAVGIAAGNMGALIPIVFLIYIQIYYFVLHVEGKKVSKTYAKEERDDALQGLAVQLLMMRDNRFPPTRRSAALAQLGRGSATPRPTESGVLTSADNEHIDKSSSESTSTQPGFLHPSVSVLRILTDELMENAYISTYFDEDSGTSTSDPGTSGPRKTLSSMSTVSNPLQKGEVELRDVEKGSSRDTTSSSSGKPIDYFTVLNEDPGKDSSVVNAFLAYKTESNRTAVDTMTELIAVLDGLMKRMAAALNSSSDENFWSIGPHTAVLHHVDLDDLLDEVKQDTVGFSAYVRLVMKVYQLLNWHIRIANGCSVEEMDSFRHTQGYRVGSRKYSILDIEQRYSTALDMATRSNISLDLAGKSGK